MSPGRAVRDPTQGRNLSVRIDDLDRVPIHAGRIIPLVVNDFAAVRHVQGLFEGRVVRVIYEFFHSVTIGHTAAIRVAGRIGSEVFVIEIRKSPSSTDPDVAELYMAVKVPRPFKWVR